MTDITQLSRHLIPTNLILCYNKPKKPKPEGQKKKGWCGILWGIQKKNDENNRGNDGNIIVKR